MSSTLAVIILSYNTKNLLQSCINSLKKSENELNFEVIVVDNSSSDGSIEMVKKEFPWVKLLINRSNLGFAAGNNTARNYCDSEFILFLNSDTLVKKHTLAKTVKYLEEHPKVGAVTCKILLPDGRLDKDARRSFITPWIGLTHLYLQLDRIFPKSRLFSQYWYGYIPENVEHEVDALQGAFFLTRKNVLDGVDWFDEDYFLDGEDIDLSWRIKEKGWKIMYYPEVSIIHIKGATKGKNKETKKYVSLKEKMKYRMSGVNSMEIFVRKRLWKKHPLVFNLFVLSGIRLLKVIRFTKLVLLG